ncbi:MAG: hypothetical protein ACP5KB_05055, partial [Thermoprotei archaeon]
NLFTHKYILTPGPTEMPRELLLSILKDVTNPDLDPQFYDFYHGIFQKLARIFESWNHRALILLGEGMLGLESSVVNMLNRGEKGLVFSNGFFGDGFSDLIEMTDRKAIKCRWNEREAIPPEEAIEAISRIIQQYVVQFHHWEYLGKYYNIYVVWPKSSVVEVLRGFRPGVIILNDLGLGVKYGGTWNWDLRDIVVEGKPILEHIVSYVKQNHAGVIATHSTLSDEIVWLSCESRVKLGARGHVGYNLNDIDVMDEKTVASLLGMPELALWEYVRDKVAETLCNLSKTLSSTQLQLAATLMTAAVVVGSTPLQVPHIPWNGTLKATPEARDSGWDLPEAFVIEMPTLTR